MGHAFGRRTAIALAAAGLASAAAWLHASDASDDDAPIEVSQAHQLARGHWMETRAVLSRAGRIDVFTRTWSKNETSGFHGAVVVFLVDEHRNRLYSTKPRPYGVNSKYLPGDDRTDTFHEKVPAEIIAKADGIVIEHLYQPESEILDRLRDAKAASGYLAGILAHGARVILLSAIP
jgi:hypothetical protein